MPNSPNQSELYQRRRLIALIAAAVAAIAVLLLAGLALDGTERVIRTVEGAGPSPAAREWAHLAEQRRAATVAQEAAEQVSSVSPVVRHGGGTEPLIALTFDDGPSQYTPEILAILDRFEVPGTFFVIGGVHDGYGATIKDLMARGHVVANHTVAHPAMDELSAREQADQIDDQTTAITTFGGARPRLFRPPYAAWNEVTLELLERRGMLMVLWSVETGDFAQPGPDAIVERTLNASEPGSIVLMHDGGGDRTQTVAALPRIIEGLREAGYELVSVPELLQRDPPLSDQR